jgi:hypothetical protein
MPSARLWYRGTFILALLAPPIAWAQAPAPSPSPSPSTIEDRVGASESTLARILRTTVSGYVQARGTDQDTATPESNLFVRRARLNLRHSFHWGRFALSFDGGQNADARWGSSSSRPPQAKRSNRGGRSKEVVNGDRPAPDGISRGPLRVEGGGSHEGPWL